jgi:hypothetical protein
MYEFDLVSAVVGYIIGVILCHNTQHILFMEKNDESE